MKRVFSCFLFQTRPGDSLSRGRRIVFWLWNALLLGLAAVALGLCSLALAPGQYSWQMFFDYLSRPALAALNLLPPVALAALLYGLTGRAWLAYLLTALPVLGLSVGNYYKLAFRDDPVIAADLLLLGEAGNMAGKYQLFLPDKLAAALACAALCVPLLALLARGRPLRRGRLLTAGISLACAAALVPVYGSDALYAQAASAEHINQWSSTQQYISRGLLYPFLHSVKDALPNPPEGYSERETAALLAQYQDADIPEDRKVNIVGVMLEAFADFSVFDQIEFQQDVYAGYHALEAESYSGRLLTNIFAGGTVDTERAFLTGMAPANTNYRGDTSSYVWYLKDQGYRATGDHPSNNWFYNRANVNAYLGFDQYRFMEDFYQHLSDDDNSYDYVFFPNLTQSVLEQVKGDEPLFSFSVSYQGHGPYGDYECWWGEAEDYIANYELDDASRYILSNYLGSVKSTQGFLMDMVDQFRASDEPIVLVVFGDHKPWLGNGNSVYNALGIPLDQDTKEGFYNYWSTSYLIWGNDAAKAALGVELVGEGPDISPCFLMDVLFQQLGWEGSAYMQAARECREEIPVIHNYGACITADGALTRSLSEQQRAAVRQFRQLEYYRAHHFSS
ncbi:MAG: LTA synthase family protein [Oscillospiraceae bacterium]